MDNEVNKKIKLLKDYLNSEDSIILAFLFGSQANNLSHKSSDWDIGIYLKLKESQDTEIFDEIWAKVEEILDSEVDLILLNDAPPLLVSRIIREGLPLVIKDRKFYLDFLLKITEEAEFFLRFFDDYYKIYQRAKSLNEIDKARLEKIIIFLENSIKEFSEFKNLTFKEYQKDIFKRRNVERWIENIMNSVLDISKIILAGEKREIPETYRKIILKLSLELNFDDDIQKNLSKWVELRNILAHEYLEIRWQKIENFLYNAKTYLEEFLRSVKKFLES